MWETCEYDNALDLWYCGEDMACYFEDNGILTVETINNIIVEGIYSIDYIILIRNLAFRLYIYTGHNDSKNNWLICEKLILNKCFINAIIYMAQYYNLSKSQEDFLNSIRSEKVKNFYNPFTQIF